MPAVGGLGDWNDGSTRVAHNHQRPGERHETKSPSESPEEPAMF